MSAVFQKNHQDNMGFTDVLSKLFGNKAQRDLKEITPYIDKIKAVYPEIQKLTNDQLRERTEQLKTRIAEYVAAEKKRIAELKASVESTEIDEREKIYQEVDKLEKEITSKYEDVLLEVLPEAFAIMKDTARRFNENEIVEVTATQFDRDLAAVHDFVEIDGDKALYHNHWVAGGNEIKWDMVHYDVQLIGGVVLHQGKIAEMATGEGKTLVATLPVFLNALTHNGVHVVTVNDYLSKRDSEWMGPLYMFHGLSVDCIDKYRPNSDERRKAYAADITFGTNNEFGFDYLRDNMATSPLDLVQRTHNYAIVDEVDSVLIDDARTPLIISGPVPKGEDQLFDEYKPRVERLVKEQNAMATKLLAEARAKLHSEDKAVQDEGALALFRSYKAMPKNKALIKFLSEQGVKVQMQKTEEFYMQENSRHMPFVYNDIRDEDYEKEKKENQKRIAEGLEPLPIKTYGPNALLFVVDEKNKSIELTEKGIEILTGSTEDPNFFVLPDVGAEVAELEKQTGLDAEEKRQRKDEILQNYSIKSERVHTVNQLLKAYTLFEKDVEYVVIDNKVKIVDEQTGRIMEGRRYSDGLHQAIEAKEHVQVEAATQTFATITLQNYFRMYHKLAGMTGTAETEAGEFWDIYKLDVVVIPTNRPVARIDMNDRVYKTKREKYNAVTEQYNEVTEKYESLVKETNTVYTLTLIDDFADEKTATSEVANKDYFALPSPVKEDYVFMGWNTAADGSGDYLSGQIQITSDATVYAIWQAVWLDERVYGDTAVRINELFRKADADFDKLFGYFAYFRSYFSNPYDEFSLSQQFDTAASIYGCFDTVNTCIDQDFVRYYPLYICSYLDEAREIAKTAGIEELATALSEASASAHTLSCNATAGYYYDDTRQWSDEYKKYVRENYFNDYAPYIQTICDAMRYSDAKENPYDAFVRDYGSEFDISE